MESLRPKTGLGDDKNEALDDVKKRLVGLLCLMVKQATRAGIVYCTHQGRNVVTEDDTVRGLKYAAMNFFSCDYLEEDLDAMLENLELDVDSAQYNDVVEKIINDVDASIDDAITQSCSCDLCEDMKNIESTFDAWEPEDEAEIFLKNHLVEFNNDKSSDEFDASLL